MMAFSDVSGLCTDLMVVMRLLLEAANVPGIGKRIAEKIVDINHTMTEGGREMISTKVIEVMVAIGAERRNETVIGTGTGIGIEERRSLVSPTDVIGTGTREAIGTEIAATETVEAVPRRKKELT